LQFNFNLPQAAFQKDSFFKIQNLRFS